MFCDVEIGDVPRQSRVKHRRLRDPKTYCFRQKDITASKPKTTFIAKNLAKRITFYFWTLNSLLLSY